MKRVIITGVTGFIGSALAKKLTEQGVEVIGVSRSNPLPDNVKDVDVFYNFALKGGYGAAKGDYNLQLENTLIACQYAELSAKIGCKKFVFAGSANEYNTMKGLNELSHALDYNSIYSACKIIAELNCGIIAAKAGMEFCVGRIPVAYGRGGSSNTIIHSVISKLQRGERPNLISGEMLYDAVYIDDIIGAFAAIGETGKDRARYYIGHRKLQTFREIFTEIGNIVNSDITLNFGAYPNSTALDYSDVDLGNLYNDTGFECKSDFRESILKTAKWIKQARDKQKAKIIVVGAGFSGSILAREIAEHLDRRVEIIEKRSHIGGNMYDSRDAYGVLIQRYGPHFLNTNKWELFEYLMRFAEFFPHAVNGKSMIDGKYVTFPYNFMTVREIMGEYKAQKIYSKLRSDYQGYDRITLLKLLENSDDDVSEFANILFERAYRTYTSKMWDIHIGKVDRYVLDRVPFRLGYDERYLLPDFQYLPKNGFTEIFENMLGHPNINVQLNTDALEHLSFSENSIKYDEEYVDCLIFTGNIDELFGYKFGKLPYRSLDFKYEHYDEESHQPRDVVVYPQAAGYTRSTEYRKIMHDTSGVNGSTVVMEYPLNYDKDAEIGNIPYYPVVTEESNEVYDKYRELAGRYKNLFLCGRLAEFKYYNMDICIEHALEYYNNVKEYLLK
ncbi:MAG: UDP-galactopyranose mutase [Clostridiales bacterium]|jgi:UDP-galactopyranose mutase|nr:UDP-galactopyranose mutase [Clostridiales bacterium]